MVGILHFSIPTFVDNGIKVFVGQHAWLSRPLAFKAGEPCFRPAQRVRAKQCDGVPHCQPHLVDEDALDFIQARLCAWQPRWPGIIAV